jgi:hypothetical protein
MEKFLSVLGSLHIIAHIHKKVTNYSQTPGRKMFFTKEKKGGMLKKYK